MLAPDLAFLQSACHGVTVTDSRALNTASVSLNWKAEASWPKWIDVKRGRTRAKEQKGLNAGTCGPDDLARLFGQARLCESHSHLESTCERGATHTKYLSVCMY